MAETMEGNEGESCGHHARSADTSFAREFLDTEDLYFSKFARFLVAKFPLIKRIRVIFERAEVGESFLNEMYIPTHPKNKIYIECEHVDADTWNPPFYSKLMLEAYFIAKFVFGRLHYRGQESTMTQEMF